jgi:hypothetical protein
VKTRDDLAEHRLFLLRMGVSTKEVEKRLERIRNKREKKVRYRLPAPNTQNPLFCKANGRP